MKYWVCFKFYQISSSWEIFKLMVSVFFSFWRFYLEYTNIILYYYGSSELSFLHVLERQDRSSVRNSQYQSGTWLLVSGTIRNGQKQSWTVRKDQEWSRTVQALKLVSLMSLITNQAFLYRFELKLSIYI